VREEVKVHEQIQQAMLSINDTVDDMIEQTYQIYRHALLSSTAIWNDTYQQFQYATIPTMSTVFNIADYTYEQLASEAYLSTSIDSGRRLQYGIRVSKPEVSVAYEQVVASAVAVLGLLIWLLSWLLVIRMTVIAYLLGQKLLQHKKVIYQGALGVANEMVGNGAPFEFDGIKPNRNHLPANTIYLQLMWNVKKFTTDGSSQTYFYMTYYFPPQHGYASLLPKQRILSNHKSYINV